MGERKFIDLLDDGQMQPVDSRARHDLAHRTSRFWLHDSHPELLILTYAGLDSLAMTTPAERAVILTDLSAVSAVEIFGLLAQARLSLRVVAVRDGIERVLLFNHGEVASIASNDAKDRIGNFLVRMGLVDRNRLEELLRNAPPSHRRAGQLLVKNGLMSSHELWQAIQRQVTELFCDVSVWNSGHLVVYTLPQGFTFPVTPTMGTQGLLMEAVRRVDEMSVIRSKIPSNQTRICRTAKAIDLTPDAQRLVGLCDPSRSVEELLDLMRLPDFELLHLIYSVIQAGGLRIDEGRSVHNAPQRKSSAVSEVIDVFVMALNEILEEIHKAQKNTDFVQALNAYLTDPSNSFAAYFADIQFSESGHLDSQVLLRNAQSAKPEAPVQGLSDALNELLFFALFQCSEMLEDRIDEDLARRVRMIYATLDDDH